MCTHEIWTYAECGCRIDHHVPCVEAKCLEETLPRPLRYPQTPSQPNQSLAKPRRLPQFTSDSAERMFRACSITRTVQKQFLESICEDCLMEELDRSCDPTTGGASYAVASPTSLVWDSDVKIEVNNPQSTTGQRQTENPRSLSDAKILQSNAEARISDAGTEDTGKTSLYPRSTCSITSNHTPARPTLSNADADSESSIPDNSCRGRARSRTKQLRRMAMDVSREELRLRVSSRLPSFQRLSLQNFKNELQREQEDSTASSPGTSSKKTALRPMRSLVQRFVDAQEETWWKARHAVTGLGRKMSRKSEYPTRAARMQNAETFKNDRSTGFHNDHAYSQTDTRGENYNLYQDYGGSSQDRTASVESVPPENFYLRRDDPCHPKVLQNDYSRVSEMREVAHSFPSWRDHLATDLTDRRESKHRVVIGAVHPERGNTFDDRPQSCTDQHQNKPSVSTTTTAVSSRNWTVTHPSNSSNPFSHQSYEYSSVDEDATTCHHPEELKRRLLSISRRLSYPGRTPDASSTIDTSPLQGHRLVSLVTPGDFEDDGPCIGFFGLRDIDEEMARIGLTENPWTRCRSTSTMENIPDTPNEFPCYGEKGRNLGSRIAPCDDNSESIKTTQTPPTPIRGPGKTLSQTSNESITSFASRMKTSPHPAIRQPAKVVSALSACQDFKIESSPTTIKPQGGYHTASTPSPTPSPVSLFGLNDVSKALAIHSLSTPFHHSLQPRSPMPQSIEAVVSNVDQFLPRGQKENETPVQNQARPHPSPLPSTPTKLKQQPSVRQTPTTPDRRPLRAGAATGTPSDMPDDFALDASPTSLFSCVWIRELCPGLPADLHIESAASSAPQNGAEWEVVDRRTAPAGHDTGGTNRCGRVTGHRVRSCLCQGVVKFASAETGCHGADERGRGVTQVADLATSCRSVAPVVRYVVGEGFCEPCTRG